MEPSDVTRILSAAEAGDPRAAAELLPLVYDELRKLAAARMASERSDHTLQPTALVHEAYLRLLGSGANAQSWHGRGRFFAAAAEAMRRILINRARDAKRLKRGGGAAREPADLGRIACADGASDEDLLAVDEALQRLAAENPACAELVKLRFFAGLTLADAAAALGVPRRTADRQWAYARAWLYRALAPAGDGPNSVRPPTQ